MKELLLKGAYTKEKDFDKERTFDKVKTYNTKNFVMKKVLTMM
jgi:hypothetical protein